MGGSAVFAAGAADVGGCEAGADPFGVEAEPRSVPLPQP
jgi:hypothetical protein